ncbi:uncharacterized protein LOC133180260 [Saccostrea echinata]|uniref:uncharacterized protein LOC133180260 n=1 Tax=Saccostrea echinata TaxID=191078 RepID=UPI002A808080|nr:uncharacterized protein LOC133180260 [Saccostrea echinata]
MDKEFHLNSEGKWTAPLPFRSPREPIPDNYQMALRRAKSLDASLHHNEVKKGHFLAFMQKILDNKHAELAPYLPHNKKRWYLPLFGVYHPRKPDQIRGVFDASAKYEGVSLNDQLLQGPDLINNLLGILIRFRKHMVAVVADVQQMFHSFLVEEEHRDYLRFLWHKDNKLEYPLATYRMRVHVFGNRPSPSIAMYGLQRIGELSANTHGPEVKEFIVNDFYVDDGLKSCPTEQEAIDLIRKTQDAMKVHGNLNLRLHKFASNNQTVMDAFDSQDLAKNLVELDFEKDTPTQRSLGLLWDLKTDTFRFSISDESKPSTRRGILSSVNSLYDPLGFLSLVTISGKIILRKIVASTLDWDDQLPAQLVEEWETWKSALPVLEKLQIPRVIVPNLNEAVSKDLLVYCDASELAIAAVCYLKATYADGSSSIGFLLGKAKVSPLSGHTIPRLELCAAVLAVEVAQIVVEHLGLKLDTINYFSDSRVVLGYINNETKRFFTYVANRVAHIRSFSKPTQWFYVRSEANPADVSTRGIHPGDMQNSTWLRGPQTVCISAEEHATLVDTTYPLINPDVDKEVRSNKLEIAQKVSFGLDNGRFSRFSSWKRLILALVCIRRFIQQRRSAKSASFHKMNDVDLFLDTERIVIKDVQRSVYQEEINCLRSSKPLKKSSPIFTLDPYLDADGLLRVGGRLKHSHVDAMFKNPVILPAKHHIATLITRKCHQEVKHQGRHISEGRIRSSGYWIVGGKRLLTSLMYNCVTCRRLRKPLDHQTMSDLPSERILPGYPPFSFIGVDVFGPWEIITRKTRGGSANNERWAALFTCLATRAVHIEVLEDMTTSAFINAFRRFVAIRGCVKIIRSDRGTNFVGAVNELKINTINVEDGPIHDYLTKQGTTWIFNPPHSSHMGGVWERMIGTTRRILHSMLLEYGSHSLTHDVLTTFLAEACSIINSRPLIPISKDPGNPHILTPSTLLTQKSDVIDTTHVNSEVDQKDLLCKQWKRVQHLASVFWKRWKVEYLNELQRRRK